MNRPRHTVVIDLGYGDAGKGTVVDWLCANRPVHTVVRFNGGAQAAHTVVLPDGRHHTFAQFGSGTLRGVRTHLACQMAVDPLALAAEADHLALLGVPDPLGMVTVDRRAPLATPYHRAAGRARETARGAARHGSCGMGVGEVAAYAVAYPDLAPRVADCATPAVLREKLRRLCQVLAPVIAGRPVPAVDDCVAALVAFAGRVATVDEHWLPSLLRREATVFEGAQGVLLDEWHGFHPHTTWSTTTSANADRLLQEAGVPAVRLGVLRTVTTRHGPGPLVTEDPGLTAAVPEPHNPANPWQGPFRVGHFDAVAHGYALRATGGVDGLVLTHLDLVGPGGALAGGRPGRGDRRAWARAGFCRGYQGEDLPGVEPLDPRVVADPGGVVARSRLARQEDRTRRVLAAVPVVDGPPDDWAAAVESALRTPVVAVSHGPTADDKRWVPDWSGRSSFTSFQSRPVAVCDDTRAA